MAAPRRRNARLRAVMGLAREILARAKAEHTTPAEVGLAVAVGVFAGCTPLLGFHMWIALGFATLFRLNRLLAFVGSRISTMPIFLWISFCEIELGHRTRTGAWLPIAPKEVLSHGRDLLTDWLLGTAFVATVAAASLGCLAYALARSWAGELADVNARKPAEARLPISGSPPSGPLDPSP